MTATDALNRARWLAITARDPRFDGKFFVGVKTTGVYCRPICPARPKPENIEFFASAHAAEKAGYRPCLRCRPECAPSSPGWQGKSAIVSRALRRIADNERALVDEEAFAGRFGVSARHLRRLFREELGRSPKQLADLVRLNFARQLVVETDLPLTAVAFGAGFQSVRRFNEAFRRRFTRPPSALRRRHEAAATGTVTLRLAYRPPYDWNWLHRVLASHAVPFVESFADGAYERVFEAGGKLGVVRVAPDPAAPVLHLSITHDDPRVFFPIAQNVRAMFDLDSDPLLVANAFREVPRLHRLWKKYPGLRIPRGWSPFETAVGAILGQLVSVKRGVQLLAQLVESVGARAAHPVTGAPLSLFPTPEALAAADLNSVGTTGTRKEAIRRFASAVHGGEIDLSPAQDMEEFRRKLLSIRGLGPWTAEYVALRALGETDALPATDLVLKRALQKETGLDPDRLKPWRSYLALYLWREHA